MDEELKNELRNQSFADDTESNSMLKLRQWMMYTQLTDRLSERRAPTHRFYLTSNTLLFAAISAIALFDLSRVIAFIIAFVGLVYGFLFNLNWWLLTKRNQEYVSEKFKIINEIENDLPYKMYTVEWKLINPSQSRLNPFSWKLSRIEAITPRALMVAYILAFISLLVYLIVSLIQGTV